MLLAHGDARQSACNMVVCDAGTALRTPPWTSTATQHTSSAWATLLALGGCETREFTELMSTKLHFPECEELEESQISASCAQVFSSERAKMKSGFNALICSAKSSPRKLKTHPSRRTPSMAPSWSMESRKMASATLGRFCLVQQALICHHLPLQLQVAHGLLVHLQANGMWMFLHNLQEGIQQSVCF